MPAPATRPSPQQNTTIDALHPTSILSGRMHKSVFTGRRYFLVFVFVLVVLVSAGCDIPHDPRGTLDRVQNGTMRVGVVDHDPWSRVEGGRAYGVEVELLEDFAEELGAEASFIPGTTPELLEAAKQGEVDVLIGGFTSNSPGVSEGKEAGVTSPYLTTRFVVGVPPGRLAFDDPSGRKIAVERIDGTAALLKEEGAVPVVDDDLSSADMPVVAYPWQLKAWGFERTGVELSEEKHVMAVPLGENGWLVELERFLRAHREEAEELLREETS
jgi:polar amino acid transport system substrate-binding protein